MLLKNDIEATIQIIALEKGKFIVDKNNKEFSKEDFNHFVLIHANSDLTQKWNDEMNKIDGFNLVEKITKRKTKKSQNKPMTEFDYDDKLVEREVMEEDLLGYKETQVSLNSVDELIHIARSRKINIVNTDILGDNNWFICPIYSNINGLYPILHKKLDNKKGYKLFESKVPLITFKENLFKIENFKEWNCNSTFILERYFEKEKIYELSVEGVYVQKRENDAIVNLRNVLTNYEIAKKSRIRCGNILISLLLYSIGQNSYITNKENISKNKSTDDEDQDDLEFGKETKIIEQILGSYKKLNDKLKKTRDDKINHEKIKEKLIKAISENNDEKIDTIVKSYISSLDKVENAEIRTEKTFNNIMELVTEDEEKEAYDTALKYLENKKHRYPNMTIEEALDKTKTLKTKDYIPNFNIYKNISIYKYYEKAEKRAESILEKLVEGTWLQKYSEGIKGMGTVIVSYILAYIDFHSTVHSSSLFRYLGMDQVTTKPEHSPGQMITRKEQEEILKFLFKSYNNIIYRSCLTAAMPLTEKNFTTHYKTDVIPTWKKFQIIKNQFKEFGNITEDELEEYMDDIIEDNDEVNNIINNIWENSKIIYKTDNNGNSYQVLEKRARNKKNDRVRSTYLDASGNVKFKEGLGYNAKLKSKLLYILFTNLKKQRNEYYINIFKYNINRLTKRFEYEGKDPTIKENSNHIKAMARRQTIQIFLKELWIYARKYFKLPLNGEGYNDYKYDGCNHIHNRGTEDPEDLFSIEE